MENILFDKQTEFEYTVQQVNTARIEIEPMAQRDVERRKSQFNKIMANFDQNLVQDIKVAAIDGKYICFDGQMTRKVLIARNGGKDTSVRCKVYQGMTYYDVALQFLKQTGYTSKITKADEIRVMANYGIDGAPEFVRIVEKNGLFISYTGTKAKNSIVAVSSAWAAYKSFKSTDDFDKMLRIIKRSWNGDADSLQAGIIKGLSFFMRTYKDEFDEDTLVSHLSEKNPREMLRNARVDSTNGDRKYAIQFLLAYNFRLREENRLPNKM